LKDNWGTKDHAAMMTNATPDIFPQANAVNPIHWFVVIR